MSTGRRACSRPGDDIQRLSCIALPGAGSAECRSPLFSSCSSPAISWLNCCNANCRRPRHSPSVACGSANIHGMPLIDGKSTSQALQCRSLSFCSSGRLVASADKREEWQGRSWRDYAPKKQPVEGKRPAVSMPSWPSQHGGIAIKAYTGLVIIPFTIGVNAVRLSRSPRPLFGNSVPKLPCSPCKAM